MSDIETKLEKLVSSTLAKLVPAPAHELSELIADQLRYYRWRSLVRIAERAADIRRDKGLHENSVPIKILLPLLEEGSKEEESSEMLEVWAKLLAAADENSNAFDLQCIDLLGKITSREARIIDELGKSKFNNYSYFENFIAEQIPNDIQYIEHSRGNVVINQKSSRYIFDNISSKFDDTIPNAYTKIDSSIYSRNNERIYISHDSATADANKESFLALERLGIISESYSNISFRVFHGEFRTVISSQPPSYFPPDEPETYYALHYYVLTKLGAMLYSKVSE